MKPAAARFVPMLACAAMLALAAQGYGAAMDSRLEAAVSLYREEGAAKALPMFAELARVFERQGQPADYVSALHYIGECHWRLGDFAAAHQYLDRALARERAAGDRLSEGKTLNVLGLMAWDEGNYDSAISHFQKAGELARAAGDRKLEGSSLNNLSLVYDEQGNYDTSLAQYQRVLELYRGADFPRGVGDTLGNIGGVHLLLGHFKEALGYYERALQISVQLKSNASMSQDHGNIALCLVGMGEPDQAYAHLDQAIALANQAGMRQDAAYWLRVRGDAHAQQGAYHLALQDYHAALATYAAIGAKAEHLEALHASGDLHLLLGDAVSAERDFRRAIDIARTIGFDRGITAGLLSLGDLELRRNRPEAALTNYEQARRRAADAGARPALAESLLRLARVHRNQGSLTLASSETNQSLAIAKAIGAPALEAEALFARAEVARLQRQYAEALRHYAAAEHAEAHIQDPDLLWQVRFGRARAHEASGNVRGAIESLEAAVELIESVRGRLREPRFRAGYVEDKFAVYLELLRLQLQQGDAARAFTTAERLRAYSFQERLGGRASIPLTAEDRRREAEMRARVRQLQQSLAETNEDGSPAYPERAMHRFSAELSNAERDYQGMLDDRAAVHPVLGTPPTAEAIRHRLAPGRALVEYVVGPESVVAFVLTSGGIHFKTLPLRDSELLARIELLRDLIQRRDDQRWVKPAARLAMDLLEPLERAGWLDGVEHLYLVPHGPLTYLPFALLPQTIDAKQSLLIDRYTVAYLPAAAALLRDAPARHATSGTLLAVAPSRGQLRHAPEEARAIDALFRPRARSLIGVEATESRFKKLAGAYDLLHLATHGYFDRANPLLSGLELESDGFDDGILHVHEVLDLQLHARLVTLSACDTALGSGYFSDVPAGDDFIALNRAFLSAGSAYVMATLWPVDDRASVSLMLQFYRRLSSSRDSRDASSALAQAQRALRRSPQLAHPYFWAAYVVVGGTGMGAGAVSATAEQRSPGRGS